MAMELNEARFIGICVGLLLITVIILSILINICQVNNLIWQQLWLDCFDKNKLISSRVQKRCLLQWKGRYRWTHGFYHRHHHSLPSLPPLLTLLLSSVILGCKVADPLSRERAENQPQMWKMCEMWKVWLSLGKPLYKKSAVQTEIHRKGEGGVENPFQMECGSSSVNINHY